MYDGACHTIGNDNLGFRVIQGEFLYENIKTLDEGELSQNSAYYKAWAKAYPNSNGRESLGDKYFNLFIRFLIFKKIY